MSALGHKRTFGPRKSMSALPPKADIAEHRRDVRFVPKPDVSNRNKGPFTCTFSRVRELFFEGADGAHEAGSR
jgi:hypothetical protein